MARPAPMKPRTQKEDKLSRLPPFVVDIGNAYLKCVCGDGEIAFVHALAELMPSQWDYATQRFGEGAPYDLIRFGDRFFAVGATAENFHMTKLTGRPKYSKEYYGVFFAAAVANMFRAKPDFLENGLDVVASHATDDFGFRGYLSAAIRGKWDFECGGKRFKTETLRVRTFEESFGGYARKAYKFHKGAFSTPLRGQFCGIIDIGGGTCGVMAVDEMGVVQQGMGKSGSVGILNSLERLKAEVFRKYGDLFKNAQNPPESRFREALQTGIYRGFGQQLDVHKEVDMAIVPLMNDLMNLWKSKLQGGAGLDTVVLTGGGNGILAQRVKEIIEFQNCILADNRDQIHYANVRGARDFMMVAEELR